MAYVKIRPRRSTAAEWEYDNPVLAEGEMGIEVPVTGVGTGYVNVKFGDGVTTWIELPYGIKSGYTGGGDSSEELADLATRVTALENFVAEIKPKLVVIETPVTPSEAATQSDDGIDVASTDDYGIMAYSETAIQELADRVTALETDIYNIQSVLLLLDDEE